MNTDPRTEQPAAADAGLDGPREFPLTDVLTVTTGRYFCTDVGGLYTILEFLTGDTLVTHQLAAAADAVRAGLLDQLPHLADTAPPPGIDDVGLRTWLDAQFEQHGPTQQLRPVSGWGTHSPLADLLEIMTRASGDGASNVEGDDPE